MNLLKKHELRMGPMVKLILDQARAYTRGSDKEDLLQAHGMRDIDVSIRTYLTLLDC